MLTFDEELNDQVLRQMREGGDDLSTVRPVCFQLVFPSRENALAFAEAVQNCGLSAKVNDTADGPVSDLPWDVNVTIELRPELVSISDHERKLGQMAAYHQGRNDGWFCERIVQSKAQGFSPHQERLS